MGAGLHGLREFPANPPTQNVAHAKACFPQEEKQYRGQEETGNKPSGVGGHLQTGIRIADKGSHQKVGEGLGIAFSHLLQPFPKGCYVQTQGQVWEHQSQDFFLHKGKTAGFFVESKEHAGHYEEDGHVKRVYVVNYGMGGGDVAVDDQKHHETAKAV